MWALPNQVCRDGSEPRKSVRLSMKVVDFELFVNHWSWIFQDWFLWSLKVVEIPRGPSFSHEDNNQQGCYCTDQKFSSWILWLLVRKKIESEIWQIGKTRWMESAVFSWRWRKKPKSLNYERRAFSRGELRKCQELWSGSLLLSNSITWYLYRSRIHWDFSRMERDVIRQKEKKTNLFSCSSTL